VGVGGGAGGVGTAKPGKGSRRKDNDSGEAYMAERLGYTQNGYVDAPRTSHNSALLFQILRRQEGVARQQRMGGSMMAHVIVHLVSDKHNHIYACIRT
jgi:hypothetical protein